MSDINDFIKNLARFGQIDFRGKEAELGILAQKYDKNKNSIFEQEELQQIADDLTLSAKSDTNENELSAKESRDFMRPMQKPDNSVVRFFKSIGRAILREDGYIRTAYRNRKNSQSEKITNDLMSTLLEVAQNNRITEIDSILANRKNPQKYNKQDYDYFLAMDYKMFERARKLISETQLSGYEIYQLAGLDDAVIDQAIVLYNEPGNKDRFSMHEISYLAVLDETELAQARKLINETNLSGYEISEFSKLNNTELNQAFELYNDPEIKNRFSIYEISFMAKLSPTALARAQKLISETQFSGYEITELAKLDENTLNRTLTLYNEPGIKNRFSIYETSEFGKLNDTELNRAKKLINETQFSADEILILSKLNDTELSQALALYNDPEIKDRFEISELYSLAKLKQEELNKAREYLFNLPDRDVQLSGTDIAELAKLSEEEFKRAQTLLNVPEREEQFCGSEIVLLAKLSENEFKCAQTLFSVPEREEQFNVYDIVTLVRLSEVEFERAKTIFNVPDREVQFSGSGIATLAKLSEDRFKRAQTLFNVPEREKQFSGYDIATLARLSEVEFERAKTLFNVPDREEQFSGSDIAQLAQLSKDKFERAQTLFNVPSRAEQFDGFDIAALAKLSETEFNIAQSLFNVPEREEQFSGSDIAQLAQLSKDKFERAQTLFNVPGRAEQFDGFGIIALAQLSKDEFEHAQTLFNVNEGIGEFSGSEIAVLAKLSKTEFKRAQTLFRVQNRENQFSGFEIAALAKLSDDELRRAKTLFQVQNRKEQFKTADLIKLAKLDDNQLQWVSNYFGNENFNSYDLTVIARNRCDELQNFLQNNPDPEICYTAGNCIKFKDSDNKFYTFDQTGLIETGSLETIPDNDTIIDGEKLTFMNTKLNVKHEVSRGKIPGGTDDIIVFSEFLTYYNSDGKVIRTVTLKRNPQNGLLNISETDKDGNTIPVQWEGIDPDTGAEITERHVASPDGTKTDYYSEKSDNLKVTEYKITDKQGNVLLNVHQTLEQIADNKFISSINTTDNPKNTQIYEIEYTGNNMVKIFDKTNNTTTEIDLSKYFTGERTAEELLPIIKQLPGQVLLEFAEKPLLIDYNIGNTANGYWDALLSTIQIGNFNQIGDKEATYLMVMTHELGHYLDLYQNISPKLANNPEILDIYEQEFETFISETTPFQQRHISYFTDPDWDNKSKERLAESHVLLYSNECSFLDMRRYYFAQYFPRTIAAITRLLLEEEGVRV